MSLLQYRLWLCQLQDELQRLPAPQRQAYEYALLQAPLVVQTESNPLQFFRAERGGHNNNIAAQAARRLCHYWQDRQRTFGPQRAWLRPILRVGPPAGVAGVATVAASAASSGPHEQQQQQQFYPGDAFEAQDVQAILQHQASGAVTMLPPDTTGCSVLLLDPSRMSSSDDDSSDVLIRWRRVLFYTLQCLAQNPHSQNEGIVLIARLHHMNTSTTRSGERHPSSLDDSIHETLGDLIRNVFPLSGVKGLHLVACLDNTAAAAAAVAASSTWIQQVLPLRQAQWETSFCPHQPPVLHIAANAAAASDSSATNLLAGTRLQAHGLLIASLPETLLSGLWQLCSFYEDHHHHQQPGGDDSSSSSEKKMPAAVTAAANRKRPASSQSSFAASQQHQPALRARMASSATEEGGGAAATASAAAAAFRGQQQPQVMAVTGASAASIPPPPPTMPTTTPAVLLSTNSRSHDESNVDNLFQDTATMRQLGLARLREAMLFLPDDKRAAYLEAMAICPDLVQTESDPVRFLRYVKKSETKFRLSVIMHVGGVSSFAL
jgi:hypothetical protein